MIFKTLRVFCLTILFLVSSSSCYAQEKFLPYPGVIHIHSNISEGIYSPAKLVSLTKDKGIKILIFSDSFLRRWEYGLPIFSNIFKVSIEGPSVVKYGIKRYLEEFKKLKNEFPDTLILEGVEVAPFYWWSGSFFKKNLLLNDGNRHLLVVGLKDYQDYARLPIVCNRYFLPQLKDTPYLCIAISMIILGIFLFKKRSQKKFVGLTLSAMGILFLLHIFPFSASRYSPYNGQREFYPYQDLINYVRKKGGFIFWAHPEVTELVSQGQFLDINFYTPSYPEALILTSNYTGFGVNMLPGTDHNLIFAGDRWDNALISYCQGKRSQPVWAIGEADYRGTEREMGAVQNIFFLSEFKVDALYEAMRRGRLYIRYYANISLVDFHIEDSQNVGNFALMGDEIEVRGKPRLRINGSYSVSSFGDLRIEIIRDGKIIQEFSLSNENAFDLEFQDDSLKTEDKKTYYRLNFFADGRLVLVTNPIFVEIKNG